MMADLRGFIAQICRSSVVAQLILTAVPAWFSAVLAMDDHTFGTADGYLVMASIMTEAHWAALGGCVVVVAALAWTHHSRASMIFGNMVLAFWHGLIALCIFLASPIATGTGTYALLALAATLRMIGLANAYSDRN